MRRFTFVCAVISQCSFSAASGFLYGSDDTLREQFLTQAPKQWLEYRRIVSRHTEIVETGKSSSSLNNERQSYRLSGSLNLDRKCARFLDSDGKGGDVWNPEYYFQVEKESEHKWKLISVARTPPKPTKSTMYPSTNSSVSLLPKPPVCILITPEYPDDLIGRSHGPGSFANLPTTFARPMQSACLGQNIWRDWLTYIVSSPDFRLLRIKHQGSAGQFVEVEFSLPAAVNNQFAPTSNGGGVLLLDPKRYWQIREADIHGYYADQGKKTLKITNEFKDFVDGSLRVPYVSHQLMSLLLPEGNKGKPFYQEWRTEIDMSVTKDLDGKQFYLPYYGLPEPTFNLEGKGK